MLRAPCHRIAASLLGISRCSRSTGSQQPLQHWLLCAAGGGSCSSNGSVVVGGFGGASSSSSCSSRQYSADAAGGDYTQEVDSINEKFVEAREEIEYAREDAETVYFNESAEVARKAVGDVLEQWQGLLERLPTDEQAKLQRSMGLKIEQLKAELKELDELHA